MEMFLEFKLFLHLNCVLMLSRMVWNGTVFFYIETVLELNWTELFEIELVICIKMDLALNNLQRLICRKTQPTNQQTPVCRLNYPYSCFSS